MEDTKKIFDKALLASDTETLEKILLDGSEEQTDELLRQVWNKPALPVDEDLKRDSLSQIRARVDNLEKTGRRSKHWRILFEAAAVIAITITLWLFNPIPNKEIRWAELITPYGKIDSTVLSDGTKIWLNAGSRLLYPMSFSTAEERRVFVSGEAYFEVAKDRSHPFIVSANGVEIKVLGTTFDVKAYMDEDEITTTLLSGAVLLTPPSSEESYRMVPGRTLVYNRTTGDVDSFLNKETEKPMWQREEMNFYNLTLDQIAKNLERRFNISIIIRNPDYASMRFYASFVNNENADQILSALNLKRTFTIKKEGGIYDIY